MNLFLPRIIEVESRAIRLKVVNERTAEIIKKIIYHHVGRNNTIITDDWPAYQWLNSSNDYYHIVHVHGRHDLGHGS